MIIKNDGVPGYSGEGGWFDPPPSSNFIVLKINMTKYAFLESSWIIQICQKLVRKTKFAQIIKNMDL